MVIQRVAELGHLYVSVCTAAGKGNIVQPYVWLGIEDREGLGNWRDMNTKHLIKYKNWDAVSQSYRYHIDFSNDLLYDRHFAYDGFLNVVSPTMSVGLIVMFVCLISL